MATFSSFKACFDARGKAGKSAVASRFNTLSTGDWGFLVKQWKSDMSYEEERAEREGRYWLDRFSASLGKWKNEPI